MCCSKRAQHFHRHNSARCTPLPKAHSDSSRTLPCSKRSSAQDQGMQAKRENERPWEVKQLSAGTNQATKKKRKWLTDRAQALRQVKKRSQKPRQSKPGHPAQVSLSLSLRTSLSARAHARTPDWVAGKRITLNNGTAAFQALSCPKRQHGPSDSSKPGQDEPTPVCQERSILHVVPASPKQREQLQSR